MAPVYLIWIVYGVVCCLVMVGCNTNTSSWQRWHWKCTAGQCLRTAGPSDSPLEQSPGTCRLNCGRHGSLWPRPTGTTVLDSTAREVIPDSISLDTSEVPNEVLFLLNAMAVVFLDNLKLECGPACCTSSAACPAQVTPLEVRILVSSADLTLNWTTDEGYSLDLYSSSDENVAITAQIHATTIFGARHALETLAQLTTRFDYTSTSTLLMLSSARVMDRPAYPHRGLMLDTARHFLSMESIKRTLDGMAASKMNVMHWHATDSHSFPLVTPRVPQLAAYGAYSPLQTYSPAEVRNLVKYARVRGIRVVMEFDAPAHAGAGWEWGREAGLGDLVLCWAYPRWRERCVQPPCGQLNPANPHVFRLLGELYKDLAQWIPDEEIFHMGGDEVFFPCWNSSSEVINLMHSRGMAQNAEGFLRLWGEYQATALRIWDEAVAATTKAAPGPIVMWSSHLTSPSIIEDHLPKERYVIQSWVVSDDDLPVRLSELGYRVIISTKDAWYLDHGFWGTTDYHTWRKIYDHRLPRFKSVLGGEACMWTEYVDENVLDGRIWPRAAAIAERLWADPGSGSAAAEGRFTQHRERLIARGLKPDAIQPLWCYQREGKCA